MSWTFNNDIVFYSVLGTLALLPLAAVVAALKRQPFRAAFDETRDFLARLAEVPGERFWLKVTGATAGIIVLLALAAYSANRLGDSLLPQTSRLVGYFGNARVMWTTEYPHDWERVMFDFRVVSGIGGDRNKWDRAKADMGKYDSRFFRTLFVFALLWSLASLTDLFWSPSFRRRGAIGLTLSLIVLLAFQWVWLEREAKFIENLVASYESEHRRVHNQLPTLPESYNRVVLKETGAVRVPG